MRVEMDHTDWNPNNLTLVLGVATIVIAIVAILMAGIGAGWLLP